MQELGSNKTYKHIVLDEMSVVDRFWCHMQVNLLVEEEQGKLNTIYWLHTLHKRPYKPRFIATSY